MGVAKNNATAAVDKALAGAKRDRAGAVRTLLRTLFAGNEHNPLAPALWTQLSALADRARAVRMSEAPASGAGLRPEALGDNWFQCPQCADAFEGVPANCPGCGRAFAVARQALEIELGDDARVWLVPSSATAFAPIQDLSYLASAITWMRVEAGPRWFELFDDAARSSAAAALTAKLTIPPNVTPIGAHEDGTIALAHVTKLELYVVRDHTLVAEPHRTRLAPEVVVRQIVRVMFPDGAVPTTGESTAAETALRAAAGPEMFEKFALARGKNGYLEDAELLALLRTDGVSSEALRGIARGLLDGTSFIPGGTWMPDTLPAPEKRRPGSPLLLMQAIVEQLQKTDPDQFTELACELLGHVLCDPDVYDHDALALHADMASELVDALVAVDPGRLTASARGHVLVSFERACAAARPEQLELAPLADKLRPIDAKRVDAALARHERDD